MKNNSDFKLSKSAKRVAIMSKNTKIMYKLCSDAERVVHEFKKKRNAD